MSSDKLSITGELYNRSIVQCCASIPSTAEHGREAGPVRKADGAPRPNGTHPTAEKGPTAERDRTATKVHAITVAERLPRPIKQPPQLSFSSLDT